MRLLALMLAACDSGVVDDSALVPVPADALVDLVSPADPVEPDAEADAYAALEECFGALVGGSDVSLPRYEQFEPTIASHCNGTDHQDIEGIERVVFLGDSVTVGTPPTLPSDFYRSILADGLAAEFGIEPPSFLWEQVNPFDGTAVVRESGAFASCAEWGARAEDLLREGTQLEDCFPPASRGVNTLVVMTVGGNDLSSLTTGFTEGRSHEELWAETHAFMADVREAVAWLEEPGRFPAGISIIFTDLYEFTDATGDTTSCPAAALAGFDEPVTDPALPEMVVWAMEEFMSIAVDSDSDMLFLLEQFCGHGYHRDDPDSVCYRGPDAELWFDATCIHPNPAGHAVIADMFLDVVRE